MIGSEENEVPTSPDAARSPRSAGEFFSEHQLRETCQYAFFHRRLHPKVSPFNANILQNELLRSPLKGRPYNEITGKHRAVRNRTRCRGERPEE
jgi:hypothetical protein